MTLPVNPYAQLWQLRPDPSLKNARNFSARELPEATAFLQSLDLEKAEASAATDQLLHQLASTHSQSSLLAWLCLRCRASAIAAQATQALFYKLRNFSRNQSQLEVSELAALVMDDNGEIDPESTHTTWRSPHRAKRSYTPFTLQCLRKWEPGKGSLGPWIARNIQGDARVKNLLRQHGCDIISTWAIIGNGFVSEKTILFFWPSLGAAKSDRKEKIADLTSEQAVQLMKAFRQHYRQAINDYRQRTGRRSGWMPDQTFFETINPGHRPETTQAALHKIARCWRMHRQGLEIVSLDQHNQSNENQDHTPFEPPAPQEEEPLEDALPAGLSTAETIDIIDKTLASSIKFPPSHKQVARQLKANGSQLLCLCQAEAGLSQRQIAKRCFPDDGKNYQPSVFRYQKMLEEWAQTIAIEALISLKQQRGFEQVGQSPEDTFHIHHHLSIALRCPRHPGGESLLSQAIERHLNTP